MCFQTGWGPHLRTGPVPFFIMSFNHGHGVERPLVEGNVKRETLDSKHILKTHSKLFEINTENVGNAYLKRETYET